MTPDSANENPDAPAPTVSSAAALLESAGYAREAATEWVAARPPLSGRYHADALKFSRFFELSHELLSRLPDKPARRKEEAMAARLVHQARRAARQSFLGAHVETLYAKLSSGYRKFMRLEDLVFAAGQAVAGLTPTPDEVARDAPLMQADKDGVELDQGLFLCHVLAHARAGEHLCHAMLLPRAEALDRLGELHEHGAVDLGAASVERVGQACFATLNNPRYLNAEDDSTLDALEIAVDLCLLDRGSQVAVLRGGRLDHPRYGGARAYSSGINLTRLYQGKIPYLWYITREMGFLNKIFRGLAQLDVLPDGACGGTREKPWIAQVDKFAIGGGCQQLLVMDCIVAASDAYMTLPARKEGIIPGCANLRLPRFVGDRLARQAVMMERRFDCDSPEGRLICDVVVAPENVDAAVADVIKRYTGSGVVSAAGNRRAFRAACEPLDLFRRYMSVYAREQAYCHFSPALLANLEQHWQARTKCES